MILLDVAGMTCEGCEKAVRRAIASEDPAAVIVVDRAAGRVSAETALSPDQAVAAVEAAGYDASAAPETGAIS